MVSSQPAAALFIYLSNCSAYRAAPPRLLAMLIPLPAVRLSLCPSVQPDFFDYFSAVEPLLDEDRTLLAASAWSDIGQAAFVSPDAPPAVAAAGVARVHRSDFFPGLGWMLTRHAWEELGPKWPAGFWDDWLREPAQRGGRAFLRPEISRSYTFGQEGVSQAQFFAQYLGNIRLNDRRVDWAAADLRYLAPVS